MGHVDGTLPPLKNGVILHNFPKDGGAMAEATDENERSANEADERTDAPSESFRIAMVGQVVLEPEEESIDLFYLLQIPRGLLASSTQQDSLSSHIAVEEMAHHEDSAIIAAAAKKEDRDFAVQLFRPEDAEVTTTTAA
ncbi:hypothetical protein NM208_g3678 [Fusarium decemcellulare]|uniref:Uncharacterized protein n=1 Tax=Fusarium decemcellulare TaxID=57161 RepID=A0ACC1SNE2_9HYPO|nr:hypothetical protein NM208_g3678 [Fusarium decemcellulare]